MKNEITLIVGRLGVGKTTLANHALQQYEEATVITNFPQDFNNCPFTENLKDIVKFKKICFVSDDIIDNEIAMRFTYELGDRLLIIDEAHLYSESNELKKIIRYSRHKNLDVILISHSFFDFVRLNRQLVHNIIVFKITEPYELSYADRFNPNNIVRQLENHEFIILQGNLPLWLSAENLEKNGEKLVLRVQLNVVGF